jgi:hypothetical protein
MPREQIKISITPGKIQQIDGKILTSEEREGYF